MTDRTFNKIALYSAVFAGFAYVGYKVIKENVINASRKPRENRLYVRRLSGSDLLLGKLESNVSGEFSFKPLNRIKDLNLRAFNFRDAVLSLGEEDVSPPGITRSLRSTPIGSPKRPSSPENFAQEEEYKLKVAQISLQPSKFLTSYDAKCLIALLHSHEINAIRCSLVTLLKSTALFQNHKTLREADLFPELSLLLTHRDTQIKIHATKVIANMALNMDNQSRMKFVIPSMTSIIMKTRNEELLLSALIAVTNVIVLETWLDQLKESFVFFISELTLNGKKEIRLQALKLLVNISAYDSTIPLLLRAKVPQTLCLSLRDIEDDEEILRISTALANILPFFAEKSSAVEPILPLDHMRCEEIKNDFRIWMKSHPHEDIRKNSRIIYLLMK